MPRKFTANGTFIPQDAADNDMCILFMKYGCCRFKTKCKKSHWVPPLPDNPYPVEIKPPLPTDDVLLEKVRIKIRNLKHSSNDTQKELLESISQHCATSAENIDFKVSSKADISKQTINCMLPKRFKYVFHDKCDNLIAENAGVSRLFNEAGAYFDNVTQKLQICEPPKNKIEKRHLKVLRRIHWRNTQSLKEKLSQYPPSYNLVFDRSKINFARLQPYVYVLIHECMCVGGEKKPVKPSSFEYLIADTLLAYVDSKCITPQEAEEKLQQWGARAVRARQCITHLWHILAISSKSPDGCAKDVIRIEEEVIQGTRTSLDYACVCAFASKRGKLQTTTPENCQNRRKINTSIKQGLETRRARKTKINLLRSTRRSSATKHVLEGGQKAKGTEKHVTKLSEHEHERIKHAGNVTDHAQILIQQAEAPVEHVGKATMHAENASEHEKNANEHVEGNLTHKKIQEKLAQKDSDGLNRQVLCDRVRKKRKRSRQFKNVPFNERKRMKTRCVQLLSTL